VGEYRIRCFAGPAAPDALSVDRSNGANIITCIEDSRRRRFSKVSKDAKEESGFSFQTRMLVATNEVICMCYHASRDRPHAPYNTTTVAAFHSRMILRMGMHGLAGTKRIHAAAQSMHRKGEGNPHRPSSKPRTDEVLKTRMSFCERIVGWGPEQAW